MLVRLLSTRASGWWRRRAVRWLALLALPVIGLLLGLITPVGTTELEFGQRDRQPPRLLAGEFHDTHSTLWLVPADDLNGKRTRLADVPHAPGWDLEAMPAPHAPIAAVLSLPPSGWEPRTQAVLDLISEGDIRRMATGLDLMAGAIWSDDGRHLLVRRGDSLLILDTGTGRPSAQWTPAGLGSPYAVAMRGTTVWATTIDAWGTSLIELAVNEGVISVESRTRIADGITRDWTLSPDANLLAFGAQSGTDLAVRVTSLIDGASDPPLLLSSASDQAMRIAVSDVSASGGIPDSASPVWRSDGGLHFGSWNAEAPDPSGFTLPISWDAGGEWLALRSFSGTGPGHPGTERAAVRSPAGEVAHANDENLRLFGWWSE